MGNRGRGFPARGRWRVLEGSNRTYQTDTHRTLYQIQLLITRTRPSVTNLKRRCAEMGKRGRTFLAFAKRVTCAHTRFRPRRLGLKSSVLTGARALRILGGRVSAIKIERAVAGARGSWTSGSNVRPEYWECGASAPCRVRKFANFLATSARLGAAFRALDISREKRLFRAPPVARIRALCSSDSRRGPCRTLALRIPRKSASEVQIELARRGARASWALGNAWLYAFRERLKVVRIRNLVKVGFCRYTARERPQNVWACFRELNFLVGIKGFGRIEMSRMCNW